MGHHDVTRRIPALDTLRGVAILGVIVCHTMLRHPTSVGGAVARQVALLGWSGVPLFFALSGFLITRILLDARGQPDYYRHFYARRARRILPALGVLAVSLWFVAPFLGQAWQGPSISARANAWPMALFLMNIKPLVVVGPVETFGAVGALWSLGVEEQFYLAWPCIVAALSMKRLRMLCIILIPLALLTRLSLSFAHLDHKLIHDFTLSNVDQIAAGSFVAVLARDERGRATLLRWAPWVALASALVILTVFLTASADHTTRPMLTFGYPALSLGCGAIVAITALTPSSRLTRALAALVPLQWLGLVSYGAYLFHGVVLAVLLNAGFGPERYASPLAGQVLFTLLVLGLTILASILSWLIVERPILQGRSFIDPVNQNLRRRDVAVMEKES